MPSTARDTVRAEGTKQLKGSLPRPPLPSFVLHAWPAPKKGIISSPRHALKRLSLAAVDHGWFGLRPLKAHVVMLGFPRSGSTLLQLMIEACVSDIRTFGKEYWAPAAAQYALRNHSYMLTKAPWDIFFLDEIRAYYAERPANVRFILTMRDPRSILTSSIDDAPLNQPDGYFMALDRWTPYYEHVRYAQQFDDALSVKYRDLVCDPNAVQKSLTEFVGWHVRLPFDQYHTAIPRFFDFHHLNGLRPLETTRLDAWRQEKHRDRMCRALREIPDLPEHVIELGFEPDTSWVRDYL
jgi:hypothetical protein